MTMETPVYLAYLSLEETSNKDGYVGALLVTDLQSIPVEFRCTHPVKPSAIQKPLYGDSLQPFIGTELCGKPLLNSIQNKPSCLFVNSEFLLNLRSDISIPTLFVRPASEVIEVESGQQSSKALPKIKLESPTGKFQAVTLFWHPNYEDDYEKMQSFLGATLISLDILEPFSRIKKSVEVLALQDKRFI